MTHSVNPSDNVWLIITPENRLCAWFYFDPVLSYDSESTLVRFEPDRTFAAPLSPMAGPYAREPSLSWNRSRTACSNSSAAQAFTRKHQHEAA